MIDQAICADGLRVVLLVRASPLHPFSVFNYLFGLTSVKFRDYFIGSAIAMTPTTIMEVYMGTAVKSLSDLIRGEVSPSPTSQMFFLLSIVLTIVLSGIASVWLKHRMQQELDKYEELEMIATGANPSLPISTAVDTSPTKHKSVTSAADDDILHHHHHPKRTTSSHSYSMPTVAGSGPALPLAFPSIGAKALLSNNATPTLSSDLLDDELIPPTPIRVPSQTRL